MISKIVVNPSHVMADVSQKQLGINVNYLRDSDVNRPGTRPLAEALLETGVRRLRYPGGEKSDWHLFDPDFPIQIGYYADFAKCYGVLRFDDFITLSRGIGAEPHVVTAYDSLANTGVTEDRYLENAIRWLTYSNVTKKYCVRYWEIGNENWNNDTAPPEEMARIVCRFSRAMKAIDPDILICASGNNEDWWSRFLPGAAGCIDRLVVSQYTGFEYRDYLHFASHEDLDMIPCARNALGCIGKYAPAHTEHLKVIITELNSMDWSKGGWPTDNNLGHSLVTFGLLGRMLEQPRIEYGMLWNTRWMDQTEQYSSLFYALDGNNGLLPSAMPLKIWSGFLKDSMVRVDGTDGLLAFASADRDRKCLSVFLVNKGFEPRQIEVDITGRKAFWRERFIYAGNGPNDLNPRFYREDTRDFDGNISLEPVSLNVLVCDI